MERTYYIGFIRRGTTLTVQARECVDLLSCEIWRYMGAHVTTKRQLKANRLGILALARSNGFPECQRVIID